MNIKKLEKKYKQATTFIEEVAAQLGEEAATKEHALDLAKKKLESAKKLLTLCGGSETIVDFHHQLALNDSLNAADDVRKAERVCKHAETQATLVFDFWEEFNKDDFDIKLNIPK